MWLDKLTWEWKMEVVKKSTVIVCQSYNLTIKYY